MNSSALSQPPVAPPFGSLYPVREFLLGPNDGGIRRGEGDESGDNEARPTEKGSGPGHPTVDDSAFGGTSSIKHPTGTTGFDLEEERDSRDGIEVMLPDDGRLGLTNYGDVPADDWAADTGDTKTPE